MNTKTMLWAGIGVTTAVIVGAGATQAFADGMDTVPTPAPVTTTKPVPTTGVPSSPTTTATDTPATTPADSPNYCLPGIGKSPARGDGKVLPQGAMKNTEVAAKRTAKFKEWIKEHPELAKKLADQRARVHAKHAAMGNGMEKGGKGVCAGMGKGMGVKGFSKGKGSEGKGTCDEKGKGGLKGNAGVTPAPVPSRGGDDKQS